MMSYKEAVLRQAHPDPDEEFPIHTDKSGNYTVKISARLEVLKTLYSFPIPAVVIVSEIPCLIVSYNL